MSPHLRLKIIDVCDERITQKGAGASVSFYAFFKNKNDEPELLMEAATWWIETHNLNQFEKAPEIREMVMDL